MANVANLVQEFTATTGSGLTIALAPVTGFARFSRHANGTLVHYVIEDGSSWEVGIGTVQAGNTFDRTTVEETFVGGTLSTGSPARITLSGSALVRVVASNSFINTKLDASLYTAADVLAKLLTVDGAGSLLDSDFLDGQSSAYYTDIVARLGYTPANRAGDTFTGPVTVPAFAASTIATGGYAGAALTFGDIAARRNATQGALFFGDSGGKYLYYDGSRFHIVGGALVADVLGVGAAPVAGYMIEPVGRYAFYARTTDYVGASTGSAVSIDFSGATGNVSAQIQATNSGYTAAGNLVLQPSFGNVGIGGPPISKFFVQGATTAFVLNPDQTLDGDIPAGLRLASRVGHHTITADINGTAANKLVMGYYNGSGWRSAVEFGNVASGFSDLLLNKNGGRVAIGLVPGSTSTTSLETAKAISQPREISVHAHGAVGDYVPSTGAGTNDTAAIQTALDACYNAGGGLVVLDAGKKYGVTNLTIPSGVTLRGPSGNLQSGFRKNTTNTIPATTPAAIPGATVTVSTVNDTLTTTSAYFEDGNPVVLVGATLPAPLVSGTTYYARDISGAAFKVAATLGGAAIDLTTAGTGTGWSLTTYGVDYRSMGGALWITSDSGVFGERAIGSYTLTNFTVTGALQFTDHEFINGNTMAFIGGVAPAGLALNTTYYIVGADANTFKVSATDGGAPIIPTTNGSGWSTVLYTVNISKMKDRDYGGAIKLRGKIKDLYVFQKNFKNGTHAEATDQALWYKTNAGLSTGSQPLFSGVAVDQDAEDGCIENCFIGGFMLAVNSYYESRLRIDGLYVDCVNVVNLWFSFDVAYLNNIHGFYFAGVGFGSTSTARQGTFIYAHDTADWMKVSNCFEYGFKNGYVLDTINAVQLLNVGADQSSGQRSGNYGLQLKGVCQNVIAAGCAFGNQEFSAHIDIPNTHIVSLTGFTSQAGNTGVHVVSGNVSLTGAKIYATATGTKNGINNAGTGLVRAAGALFQDCTNNTVGAVLMEESAILDFTSAATLNSATDFATASVAAGSFTLTLPAANTWQGRSKMLTIRRTDNSANVLTISNGANIIFTAAGGTPSTTTVPAYGTIRLFSNGGNNWIEC